MLRKSPESKGPYFTSSRFGNQDYPYVEESRRERTGRSLKRYSEPYLNDLSSGIECRIMNLMTLLEQARDGEVLSNGPLFPWNRQQVEALWYNIAAGWSIGCLVGISYGETNKMPVRQKNSLGPWRGGFDRETYLGLITGAEKLSALVWSLADPPTLRDQRFWPDQTGIWAGQTLVADLGLRRIRFVDGTVDDRTHLSVRVLPDSARCLEAMNRMTLSPMEREWLNRTARRLKEARVCLYIFPPQNCQDAEQLIINFRLIGALS